MRVAGASSGFVVLCVVGSGFVWGLLFCGKEKLGFLGLKKWSIGVTLEAVVQVMRILVHML